MRRNHTVQEIGVFNSTAGANGLKRRCLRYWCRGDGGPAEWWSMRLPGPDVRTTRTVAAWKALVRCWINDGSPCPDTSLPDMCTSCALRW